MGSFVIPETYIAEKALYEELEDLFEVVDENFMRAYEPSSAVSENGGNEIDDMISYFNPWLDQPQSSATDTTEPLPIQEAIDNTTEVTCSVETLSEENNKLTTTSFTAPKMYQCLLCPKVFYTRAAQRRHGIRHSKRILQCNFCKHDGRSMDDSERHSNFYHIYVGLNAHHYMPF